MAIPFGILAAMATMNALGVSVSEQTDVPLRIVWDLHVSPERQHVTDWLAERGWCWAIEVPPCSTIDEVQPAADKGFVIIGQIHAHPKTREWHWKRRGMTTPDIDAFVGMLHKVNRAAPRVQFFMEDDSAGVGFSAEYLRNPPSTHAEAKSMLDAYLETAMQEARRFSDVVPWAMAGFAGTAHHYARHDAKCIIVERANDDVEDLQTAVAFARGAARQFGCEWGIDLSLWWGVIYGCVQDLPASFYTRHLWLSYISGAQVFRIEGGDLLVRPDGPTAVAKAIDAFAVVAKDIHPGRADVPVAVMLPQDHGWMTPAYWRTTNEVWNYARLPYRQGERSLDGLFGNAFPGSIYAQDPFPKGNYEEDDPPASPFALSCITSEFAPTPEKIWAAEPPIPFGAYANRNEARHDFQQNGIDPSPYRPMGDSRWGDIIDVLTDDADYDAIAAYKAMLLLGPVKIDESLRLRLTHYVEQGGVLVWAAGVASPDENDLTGVDIQPELRVGREWQWEKEGFKQEAFRYCPAIWDKNTSPTVNVLAATRSGKPLIISHQIGKGKVYTCLVPWFEAGNKPLADIALRLLDHVIKPLQPVIIDGPPLAWASSRSDETLYVVLANHDEVSWKGRITIPGSMGEKVSCRDLINNEVVMHCRDAQGTHVESTIEPYGICVLQWRFDTAKK